MTEEQPRDLNAQLREVIAAIAAENTLDMWATSDSRTSYALWVWAIASRKKMVQELAHHMPFAQIRKTCIEVCSKQTSMH